MAERGLYDPKQKFPQTNAQDLICYREFFDLDYAMPKAARGWRHPQIHQPILAIRREKAEIAFIVKAVDRTGTVGWLSEADDTGFRSLAARSMAGVFQTLHDAQTAIVKLPRAYQDAGLVFYIERTD